MGKVHTISQRAEKSDVRVTGSCLAREEQMDELMFFAKTGIRADTGH